MTVFQDPIDALLIYINLRLDKTGYPLRGGGGLYDQG
jgi:hypothetical protein